MRFGGHHRRAGLAAIVAAWFVVCGVLAMHHEATVGHVRDRDGAYVHAAAVVGHHAGSDSDVHGPRNRGDDVGDCALLTASHQAASADVTPPAVVVTACAMDVHECSAAVTPLVAFAVYRLAPKTSPPVA